MKEKDYKLISGFNQLIKVGITIGLSLFFGSHIMSGYDIKGIRFFDHHAHKNFEVLALLGYIFDCLNSLFAIVLLPLLIYVLVRVKSYGLLVSLFLFVLIPLLIVSSLVLIFDFSFKWFILPLLLFYFYLFLYSYVMNEKLSEYNIKKDYLSKKSYL